MLSYGLAVTALALSWLALQSHFKQKERNRYFLVLPAFLGTVALLLAITAAILITRFRFLTLIALTICYGTMLYIFLCEVLMIGYAAVLTWRRGSKWIKEMDYLYLLLGALGLLVSVDRYETLTDRLGLAEAIGPLILTTALVLRLVKTRAEIHAWNDAKNYDINNRIHRDR